MPHFYERNVKECKKEYTAFLKDILTPFIYEGLKSLYNYSLETHFKFLEKEKIDPKIKSPGPLKIFQTCLKEIPGLNDYSIERETNRIKEGSKCSAWFDDLIKAVIKSFILVLTFSSSENESEIVKQKYHEKVETKDFIHKCYIEAARSIYNNPELFWHEFPSIEIKRNQREIYKIIKKAIDGAIRKVLPIELILKEYLKNDYIGSDTNITQKQISEAQYHNIKKLVEKDIHKTDYNDKNLDDHRKFQGKKEKQENFSISDMSHKPGSQSISYVGNVGNIGDIENVENEEKENEGNNNSNSKYDDESKYSEQENKYSEEEDDENFRNLLDNDDINLYEGENITESELGISNPLKEKLINIQNKLNEYSYDSKPKSDYKIDTINNPKVELKSESRKNIQQESKNESNIQPTQNLKMKSKKETKEEIKSDDNKKTNNNIVYNDTSKLVPKNERTIINILSDKKKQNNIAEQITKEAINESKKNIKK